ncbi:MAG TPA: tetratricopeptide repeat protein [Candidatus Xenobia bacterium]
MKKLLLAALLLGLGRPAAAEMPGLAPLLSSPALSGPGPVAMASPPKPNIAPVDTSALRAGQLYADAMRRLAAGERDPAEDLLRRSLEIDATNVRCRFALGTLRQQDGFPEEAIAQFQQAVALEPDHPFLLTNMGLALISVGRLDDADKVLQKAAALAPTSPFPLNALAVLRERQKRWDDARALLTKAVTVDVGFGDGHVNLGLLALSQRRNDEAETQFKLAGPHNAAALNGLGVLRWFAGDPDGAEHQFEAAVSADHKNEVARYNLALYLSTAARYEEAHYYLDPLQSSPTMGSVALTLEGAIERQEGHDALAIEQLKRALTLDPAQAPAHALLGLVAMEQNDLDLAELHLAAAVELRPDDATSSNDLGLVYQRKGKLAKAIEEVEKAALIAPDAPDIQYNLGHLLDLAGQFEQAIPHLQRYLELSPHAADAPEVTRRIAELGKKR